MLQRRTGGVETQVCRTTEALQLRCFILPHLPRSGRSLRNRNIRTRRPAAGERAPTPRSRSCIPGPAHPRCRSCWSHRLTSLRPERRGVADPRGPPIRSGSVKARCPQRAPLAGRRIGDDAELHVGCSAQPRPTRVKDQRQYRAPRSTTATRAPGPPRTAPPWLPAGWGQRLGARFPGPARTAAKAGILAVAENRAAPAICHPQ
jgi:hypothetical protein